MSQRERLLTIIIGSVVVLVLNVVLIKFFLDKLAESKVAQAQADAKMAKFRLLEGERDKWAKRDAWLSAQLVPMDDKDVVNKTQKEYLQGLAQKDDVMLGNFTPGVPAPSFGTQGPPPYKALSVGNRRQRQMGPNVPVPLRPPGPGEIHGAGGFVSVGRLQRQNAT